ncbi:MAG: replication-associated recombination protein A [candidate division FCPU426 bacterium]
MDLFDHAAERQPGLTPLADRMRPRQLEEMVGQDHLLAPGKVLRQTIERDRLPSMIFWGPPGSGKTTLARLIAGYTGAEFKSYSAVTSGLKELREVLAGAQMLKKHHSRQTILFIDEIHRFNKAQQDAFLPAVEKGTVVLVGATTENPSFEVNAALLSRCRVFVLNPLSADHQLLILQQALADAERGLGSLGCRAEEAALRHLAERAHGDARAALNGLELAATLAATLPEGGRVITLALAEEALQHKALRYDRAGEEHYNLISALHKSVRGSDPDAALYWLGRMLEAGEDPLYLLRRMSRMASEDIGLADPQALVLAAAARQVFELVGLPEGKLALAQLAVYLALAPKSNALEAGYLQVADAVRRQGELEVPLHIRNAPTTFMRNLGYGKEYRYAHDYEGHWVADDYLPDALRRERFYRPGALGWEGERKTLLEDRLRQREASRGSGDQRPEPRLGEKKPDINP